MRANLSSIRFWYTVKNWNVQPSDPDWPYAPYQFKHWVREFKKLGYGIIVTFHIRPELISSSSPAKVTKLYTELAQLLSDPTVGALVERWSIGNEIGLTHYWPYNGTARAPVNYVAKIFAPAQKGILGIQPQAQIFLTSTWCSYYMGTDLMRQRLEDIVAGTTSDLEGVTYPVSERKYFLPTGGFDCHNYKNNPVEFLSNIKNTRDPISSYISQMEDAIQRRRNAGDSSLNHLSGYKRRLMLSEFNFEGQNNRARAGQNLREIFKNSYNGMKLTDLVDELGYYILQTSASFVDLSKPNALFNPDGTEIAYAQWSGGEVVNLAASIREGTNPLLKSPNLPPPQQPTAPVNPPTPPTTPPQAPPTVNPT